MKFFRTILIVASGLGAALAFAQDLDNRFVANSASYGLGETPTVSQSIVGTKTYSATRQDLDLQYTQTGLESLSLYSGGSSSPYATYQNVQFSFTPLHLATATPHPGAVYAGGSGTVTISSDGHPDLLTLNWDSTTFSSTYGISVPSVGESTIGTGIHASGELASLVALDPYASSVRFGVKGSNSAGNSFTDFELRTKATPEPLSLLGVGAGITALLVRRRRQGQS